MKSLLLSVAGVVAILSTFFAAATARAEDIVIRLKDGAHTAEVSELHARVGAKATSPFKLFKQFQIVSLPKTMSAAEGLNLYAASPAVAFAEPNFKYAAFDAGLDPLFEQQWSLKKIEAEKAWTIARGSSKVVVAVIDTGVDYTHPDLASNIWTNAKEIPGNGKDDDGNGYVDDVHGYNFVARTAPEAPHDFNKKSDPMDDHGHGSHCAGVIGAAHNGVGIMGINANVQIMAVKFLGAGGGGTLEDAMLATEYAIVNGADILSNSWGGDGYSKAFGEIIDEANRRGILYVAAAGNDHSNNDTEPVYPASYTQPNVLAVAATDDADEMAFFSNWGKTSVHIAAPGMKILSSIPGATYKAMSGTSMACPHVAGAAALVKAQLGLNALEIKKRLLDTADKTATLTRFVSSHGRLNLYNALAGVMPSEPEPDRSWTEVAYSLESPHNYPPLVSKRWTIRHPGAKSIRVHFTRLDTEKHVDFVGLADSTGKMRETLSGNQGELWSKTIDGDEVTITIQSDSENERFGFAIDKYAVKN